jgi:hypothetical protein
MATPFSDALGFSSKLDSLDTLPGRTHPIMANLLGVIQGMVAAEFVDANHQTAELLRAEAVRMLSRSRRFLDHLGSRLEVPEVRLWQAETGAWQTIVWELWKSFFNLRDARRYSKSFEEGWTHWLGLAAIVFQKLSQSFAGDLRSAVQGGRYRVKSLLEQVVLPGFTVNLYLVVEFELRGGPSLPFLILTYDRKNGVVPAIYATNPEGWSGQVRLDKNGGAYSLRSPSRLGLSHSGSVDGVSLSPKTLPLSINLWGQTVVSSSSIEVEVTPGPLLWPVSLTQRPETIRAYRKALTAILIAASLPAAIGAGVGLATVVIETAAVVAPAAAAGGFAVQPK